jgi:hypothetical protein
MIHRFEKRVAPTGTGFTVLMNLVDIGAGLVHKRIIGVSCDVKVAGTTTATVTIGREGDKNSLMTIANVTVTSLGRKLVASGADANINGYLPASNVQANSEIGLDYVNGAVDPVVDVTILWVEEQAYQDMHGARNV